MIKLYITIFILGLVGSVAAAYMQDMRVTKGLARYTANFTPPTAEFTA